MRKLITICIILSTSFACKPFDSDKLNRELIQNAWKQVQIVYPDEELASLITVEPRELTVLEFDGDSCIENIPNLGLTRRFGYEIKNYTLKLDEEERESQFLNIVKLTKDSLIVQSKYHRRKYIKRESEPSGKQDYSNQ